MNKGDRDTDIDEHMSRYFDTLLERAEEATEPLKPAYKLRYYTSLLESAKAESDNFINMLEREVLRAKREVDEEGQP